MPKATHCWSMPCRTFRPDDGVLSEEGHDDGHRLDHERVWIVDPLDGSNGIWAR